MKILDLIKQEPYLLSLALTAYKDELEVSYASYPYNPDAIQWAKDIRYLEAVINELDKLK